MTLTLLLACSGDDPAPAETPAVEPPDTGFVAWSPGDVTPAWTSEEALAAIEVALSTPLQDPREVLNVYLAFVRAGDDFCPGVDDQLNNILGCTSETGYSYAGIAGYAGSDVEGEPALSQGTIYSDFEMFNPLGNRFAVGGGVSFRTETWSSGEIFYEGLLRGIFEYPGSGASFASGLSILLYIDAAVVRDETALTLDGGVGMDGSYVVYDELAIGTESCPAGVLGSVGVRDPDGHWFVLDYGDACGTCGTLIFNGTDDMGEACLDPLPYVSSTVFGLVQ